MSLIGRFIDQILPAGSLTIIEPDGSRETYGPGGGKHVTIRFARPHVPLDIFRNPRLALRRSLHGRPADHRGRHDPRPAGADHRRQAVGRRAPGRKALGKGKAKWLKRLFRRNDPAKSRRNVAHHYDLGNALYELFLDDDLQYSCAYFTDPGQQPGAGAARQEGAYRRQADLKPGQRVLDIGCGWGGMALYLHQVAGRRRARHHLVGRAAQGRAAARRGRRRRRPCQVRADRLSPGRGTFDRIVSVGMFEHVGAAHYDEFFAKCRELLKPDGVMLLHTIGKLGGGRRCPTRSPTNISSPAITCRPWRRCARRARRRG